MAAITGLSGLSGLSGVAGGNALLDPLTFSNPWFFFTSDADLFQDTAGSTPANVAANPVRRINNRVAGVGNPAWGGAGSLSVATENGFPVLDTSPNVTLTVSTASSTQTAYTICVFARVMGAAGGRVFVHGTLGNEINVSAPNYVVQSGGQVPSLPVALSDGNYHSVCIVVNSANYKLYLDGVEHMDMGTGAASPNFSVLSVLGNNSLRVAEMFVCRYAMSLSDIQAYYERLNTRYAGIIQRQSTAIYFVGNSITNGTSLSNVSQTYPNICGLQSNITQWYNKGYPGFNMNALNFWRHRISGHFIRHSNDVCIVWEGTNSLLSGTTGAGAHGSLVNLCNGLRSDGASRIIVVSTISRVDDGTGTYNTRRSDYNNLMAANFSSYADAYIPLHLDSRLLTHTNTTYFDADGIHLVAAGNKVVADRVRPYIQGIHPIANALMYIRASDGAFAGTSSVTRQRVNGGNILSLLNLVEAGDFNSTAGPGNAQLVTTRGTSCFKTSTFNTSLVRAYSATLGAFTVGGTAKVDGLTQTSFQLAISFGGSNCFAFVWNAGTGLINLAGSTQGIAGFSATDFASFTWALSFSNGTVIVYKNGSSVGTLTFPSTVTITEMSTGNAFGVGSEGVSVAELWMTTDVLSAGQVAAYNTYARSMYPSFF